MVKVVEITTATLERTVDENDIGIEGDVESQLSDFYKEDGFDFHSYVRSDVFASRHAQARQKVRERIVEDVNRSIDEVVQSHIGAIGITREALDKAQYIAQRFGELTRHVLNDSTSYEVGLFLIGDAINGKKVITDVYIGHEQQVWDSFCDISGFGRIKSYRDITNNLRKKFLGWAHSHGEHGTFFSSVDDSTLYALFSDLKNGATKRAIRWGDAELDYSGFVFMPSLVVNARGDAPATRIIAAFPKLVLKDDGSIRVEQETLDTNDLLNPKIQIIGGADTYYLDKERIDEELIERVTLPNGERLSSMYGGVDRPPYSDYVQLSDRRIKTQSSEDIITESLKRRGTIPTKADDLVRKVERLESNYEKLQNDYNLLKAEVEELKSNKKSNFNRSMSQYYTPLLDSQSETENRLGIVAKILAGGYRGEFSSVKKGNLIEDPNSTRIWKWRDRIEAVRSIYRRFKDDFIGSGGSLNPMWEIIYKNRYAYSKYKVGVNNLKKLFSK